MSLPTEQHHCCGCGNTTTWTKHASYLTCQGCKTRFPCVKCRHLDCMEERGEVKMCTRCRYVGDHQTGCENAVDFEALGGTINP